MTLCLKQLRYLFIDCTIGREITYSCATEIRITVFTGLPIASALRSILQVITSYLFIYLKSILILPSLLRMIPPSGVVCCRYCSKSLFAYLLNVMCATVSAHLFFDKTKCAVRHPRHWVIVFRIFP
jgi:hypothetical protein